MKWLILVVLILTVIFEFSSAESSIRASRVKRYYGMGYPGMGYGMGMGHYGMMPPYGGYGMGFGMRPYGMWG
ncbi:unnamed protein product [Enterobius vermicularis]|uniref:Uncharacterized protein n=1 Tax=Enterobius vermicularis TaxID=51028 RepID=A0A0N4VFB2_ENTVE|nr:unnamed protein product [Enterobius vermicularis]